MSQLTRLGRSIISPITNLAPAVSTTVVSPLVAGAFADPMHYTTSASTSTPAYTLPDLPYDYGALEPVISGEIMKLHHSKHHQTYVTNLNQALEKYHAAEQKKDVAEMIALQSAIKFNGGGHVNHSIFWTNLAPKNKEGGGNPSGELAKAISDTFGSYDKFVEKFNAQTIAIQGSGWGWLGYDKSTGRLQISTQQNQDPLSITGLVPLLGVDVWEHAYYLQYKNVRADYVKAIWGIVNWKNVEERFAAAKK
eukprot:TRINITY_DN2185_c0_g1_i1.p1 TRINITY_DN2185_c0_g1~~TRINITY_DN2185_c0_g1_i1.p1  ORF type:complete len:251 (-),score=73.98 TRINITY_DN2185_c0_g1_i1:29-781(-)